MSAEIYSTLFESGAARRVKRTANLQPDPDGRELEVVNLYPEVKYQSVDGFGGAITAAVGDTLSRMPAGTAEEIMEAYFGPSGIGYRGIRTHLDSCDFSSKSYEAACSAPAASSVTSPLPRTGGGSSRISGLPTGPQVRSCPSCLRPGRPRHL